MSAEPAAAPVPFRAWFRQELLRELRWSVVLLAAGLVAVVLAGLAWPGFAGRWNRLNYQLTGVALHQHPVALARTFAARLEAAEYGWRPLSWSAPFNVTAAREELRRDYPEVIAVVDGRPVVPREASLRRLDAARYERRLAEFTARHHALESARFGWLYPAEDAYSLPENHVLLGRLVTKFAGLPDALLHTLRTVISAGLASILLFSTVLGLAAVALRDARRPARRWIKVLLWPALASALVWLAIVGMAIPAAFLGWATPNTAALALLASLPLLLLAAKAPFRFAEGLLFRAGPNATAADVLRTLTRSPFG